MMRIRVPARISLLATLAIVACSNDGHAPSAGGSLDIPQITKAVSGAGSLGIKSQATTGASINTEVCSICGSSTGMSMVHGLAAMFVMQGKLADANSCMINAVESAGIVDGLTSGEYKYLYGTDMKLRVKVVKEGDVVSSYEIINCYQGAQVQYIGGTNSGGVGTFSLRSKSDANFVTMDATGNLDGSTWTSKTLTVGFYMSSGPSLSKFTITQATDYLDVTGTIDSQTIGSDDGADARLVSRVQLLGTTPATYAIGDGSIDFDLGGSGTTTNWNGDTGVHGSGPTTYDSYVSGATLPSFTSSYATAFTTDETWDCSMPSDAVNFEQAAASNTEFQAAAMACQQEFQ